MARNAESVIQAAIVDYLRMTAPDCRTAAIPNGGLRTRREAALLKWTGVLAGMPDLIVIAPGGQAHLIEVKAPGGSLSAEQRQIRDWCRENAVPWMTARSIDDVRVALVQWSIPHRDSEAA